MDKYQIDGLEVIEYNPDTNTIYNSLGEVINLPSDYNEEYYENERKHHGTDRKSNKPKALRIVLGHACNYSCTYCMQKDIGDPTERPTNFNLENFKKSITNKLDLSNLTRVELWGGEPFLYWNDVQELIKFFDSEDMEFFISTNGSPLRQKHVDFFESVKSLILINISHDGPGQKALRGDDILESELTNSIIKNLMKTKNVMVGFGSVVSRTNSSLFKIHDYFKKYSDEHNIPDLKLTFTPAMNYDSSNTENSANHVIENIEEFSKEMNNFITGAINTPEKFIRTNIMEDLVGVHSVASFLTKQASKTYTSSCGADADDILSLDMFGNVRLCPHTDTSYIAGSLDDLENVKIKQLALNRKNTHCVECPVRRLCKSTCPIDFPDETFLSNCRFEKMWNGNILLAGFSLLLGKPVTFKSE